MKRSKLFIFLLVLVISLTSVTFADTLKSGSRGAEVIKLQAQLKKLGYFNVIPTGHFGSITKEAVKKFQADKGLAVDGVVGSRTTKALNVTGTSSRGGSSESKSQTTRIEVVNAEKEEAQRLMADTDTTEAEINAAVDADAEAVEATESGSTEPSESEEPAKTESKAKIELLDWWTQANKVFARGSNAKIIDVRTGKSFNIKRTYGGNHADCETLTKEDTKIMKEIWGGTFSWSRRPVIVEIAGRRLAASMAGMPHAGLDNKTVNATVSSRSAGYGRGTNLDAVKKNNMDGHFDIHFKNSRTHGSNRVDKAHQNAIKEAAAAKI